MPATVPLPASPVQRLFAAGVDILLLAGAVWLLPRGITGRVVCAGIVLSAFLVLQAVIGAGPGGALVGMRLLRISHRGGAPGMAAVGRAVLIAIAAAATAGIAPLVMVVRADATGMRRTWYDRISGTMVVSRHTRTMYTLVIGGRTVLVDTTVLLGRAPERGPGREGVRLVSVPSDDATVSKTHALLEPAAEGLAVTDLGSTNGTYIVDSRGSHELAPGLAETVPRGGTIYFGEAECRVR